jgi:hypothetical protein
LPVLIKGVGNAQGGQAQQGATLRAGRPTTVASPIDEMLNLCSPSFPATANTLEVWEDAGDVARQFWDQGSEDLRLSDDARMFCVRNLEFFA